MMLVGLLLSIAALALSDDMDHDLWPQYSNGFGNDAVSIAYLFQWSWKDIENECETLAKYGYGGVHVSPPQEHIVLMKPFRPWYERYQPVSYKLVSRSGDEKAFTSMVETCNSHGVRIIVDAVLNHMVGDGQTGHGSAGTYFQGYNTQEQVPGVPFSAENFNDHKCSTPDHNIHNYDDPNEVRHCELEGLLDLDQSQVYVRQKITDYLNHMISIGIGGIRIDASKHIYPSDIKMMCDATNNLNTKWFDQNQRLWVVQEVPTGGAVEPPQYVGNGRVINFDFGNFVADAVFQRNNFKYYNKLETGFGLPAGHDVLNFIDNHDTQRAKPNVLTFRNGNLYTLGNAFMLAYPYGDMARVMSSYFYDQSSTDGQNAGPPNSGFPWYSISSPSFNDDHTCDEKSGYVCEHRWIEIRNMVKFRQVTHGSSITNYVLDDNRISFQRPGKGFFALNNDKSNTWTYTFDTGLPAGVYCNADGDFTGSYCIGSTIEVDMSGKVKLNLAPESFVGIHIGAKLPDVSLPSPPATAKYQRTVIFIKKQTKPGQNLFVRGGIDTDRISGCVVGDVYHDKCAISIVHQTQVPSDFATYLAWRTNDLKLDWYGEEPQQGEYLHEQAMGTPLAYSTNDKTSHAYNPLNSFGPGYWLVDLQMDCNAAYEGKYFELKGYESAGDGWEGDITQASCTGTAGFSTPFKSQNHIGLCGAVNVFEFGSNSCQINKF